MGAINTARPDLLVADGGLGRALRAAQSAQGADRSASSTTIAVRVRVPRRSSTSSTATSSRAHPVRPLLRPVREPGRQRAPHQEQRVPGHASRTIDRGTSGRRQGHRAAACEIATIDQDPHEPKASRPTARSTRSRRHEPHDATGKNGSETEPSGRDHRALPEDGASRRGWRRPTARRTTPRSSRAGARRISRPCAGSDRRPPSLASGTAAVARRSASSSSTATTRSAARTSAIEAECEGAAPK